MTSTNTDLIHIDIALTDEEKALEKVQQSKPKIQLSVPADFEDDIAWELANLTRIAYKDYELFNSKSAQKAKNSRDTLHEGSTLYTSSTISKTRIDSYFIEQNSQNSTSQDNITKIFNEGFHKYSILATYNYLAYSVATPPKPDVDNFGFVAHRIKDGSNLIFVVFRGTREREEWFNNFQFKQIPFLMRHEEQKSSLEVSLGFNKIYTDYRPGILMDNEKMNRFSRWVDEKTRQASKDKYPDEHELHPRSIFEIIENTLKKYPSNDASIYVTGHSLGAALATISALHISQMLNLDLSQQREEVRVLLYTFASPRVGNQEFAKECNKRFKSYRIANSEDIVPGVPPATFRIIGQEMLPSKIIDAIRNYLSNLSGGVTEDIYEHIGNSIYFTTQLGEISSNHNMNVTYCNALRNIQHN